MANKIQVSILGRPSRKVLTGEDNICIVKKINEIVRIPISTSFPVFEQKTLLSL